MDLTRFTQPPDPLPAVLASFGLPPTARIIGSVGRLFPQKAHHILLDAFGQIAERWPEVYVVIVGDGPLRIDLEAQARQIPGGERVVFAGSQPQVEAWLAYFDLFALSSAWEGLPTVLLESMAAGVPVVATAVSGTVELIQPGQTGFLAPPNDPTAFAAALDAALRQSSADQHAMVAAARQFVEERFSITAVARQYEQLYHSLLDFRRR